MGIKDYIIGNLTTTKLEPTTQTLKVTWTAAPTVTMSNYATTDGIYYEPIKVTGEGLDQWNAFSFGKKAEDTDSDMEQNVHFSSKQDSWCTPQEVIDALAWMGPIRLDPCSNKQSIVPAVFKYDLEDGFDGLEHPWSLVDMTTYYGGGVKPGLIYINPPYGKEIGKWTKRAMVTSSLFPDDDIVMLVPARTDTKWWQEVAPELAAACFWRGRLTFLGAESSAPFPSALLYFGSRSAEFCKNMADKGWCLKVK